ncbi:Uncharacterised protein [Flavonifractor plautii]|uniref:Uncharacterized protein n=1 Tax=Flavonifractor plautii TaxID=292800 RepID=A0A174BHV7_FLAPL|nr:Uncharacterised protein [Flavonifractor plautii]
MWRASTMALTARSKSSRLVSSRVIWILSISDCMTMDRMS